MSEVPLFIKVKAEAVLPIPYEVRDDLDAIAEAGLSMLKDLIEQHVTTAVPGTIHGSWQSMPRSWRPQATPRQVIARESETEAIVLAEEIAPGVYHRVDAGDRVTFVEEAGITHPWDQGLWIFPPDHPLHDVEKIYRTNYLNPRYTMSSKPSLKGEFEVRAQMELEAGDDD